MNWKNVLKQDNPLMDKLESLLQKWKPESKEGQTYQKDLENVVKDFCPEGSKWCPECKQCETPEEAEEIHEGAKGLDEPEDE